MAHYVRASPKPIAASGNTLTYMGNKPSSVASQWLQLGLENVYRRRFGHWPDSLANGAIMQIEASFAAHIEKDVWNFNLIGDKGGAQWDPPSIFTDRAGTMINSTPAFLANGDFQEMFRIKLRHFVDGCLYNKPCEAPGEAGMAVQKILDGIYRSAEAGKEVTII